MLDSLIMFTCCFLGIVKITVFRIYADNLIINFTSAIKDYDTIDSEEKRTVMRQHAFMGRATCYSAITFSYFSVAGFIFAPLMTNTKDIEINITTSRSGLIYPIPSACTLEFLNNWTTVCIMIYAVQCVILTIVCNANLGKKINKLLCHIKA